MMLAPIVPEKTKALSTTPPTDEASTTARVYATAVVSIALDSNVDVAIVPKASGAYSTSSTTVRVATNNRSGYSVYLRTLDTEGKLRAEDKTNTMTIDPMEKAVVLEDAGANTWGYNVVGNSLESSTTYQAVPTTDTQIFTTYSSTLRDDYELSFGAKVDTNLIAGAYSGSVVVSAVANPMTITSLTGLTYMQDMTSDICEATPTEATKQLIDTRDGKSYWVAKLADGNCWMTQNLALDLDPTKTLTSADTDLPSGESYTPTSKTNEVKFDGVAGSGDTLSPIHQYSWSMGDIVLSAPLLGASCGNTVKSNDNLGDVCAKVGFLDVSSSEWLPTFTSQMGYYNYNDSTNTITATLNINNDSFITADTKAKTYDAHFLIGNFYQFNAITAGSGERVDTNNVSATDSICPRGWKLPTAGRQADYLPEPTGDFYKLLLAYGYPETNNNYSLDNTNNAYTKILNSDKNVEDNIAVSPIFFLRNGYVNLANGYILLAGIHGVMWSSSVANTENAYHLYLNPDNVYPTYYYARHRGLPARCIAR